MLLDVPDEASLGLRLFESSLAPPKGASFLFVRLLAKLVTRLVTFPPSDLYICKNTNPNGLVFFVELVT